MAVLDAAVSPFHSLLLTGRTEAALQRLAAARAAAMREGEWDLVGLLSDLTGEAHYIRGEYGLALDWYHQAAELVPELEDRGRNSITAILRDQGELEQAAAYGRRHVAAQEAAGDQWGLPYACLQLGSVFLAQGLLPEAEAEFARALELAVEPASDPSYAILARAHLAQLHGVAGDAVMFRKYGEMALTQARGRSLYLRAVVAVLLYEARAAWGQETEARSLLHEAIPVLEQSGARWLLHIARLHLGWESLQQGDTAGVREQLAAALGPANQEGYTQFLWQNRGWTLPLLAEAIRREIEVAFCQELLVKAGAEAAGILRDLACAEEPRARQAALYPLAALGGPQSVALVRHALYDTDSHVRDAAMLAYRHLLRKEPGLEAEAPLAPQVDPAGQLPAETVSPDRPISVRCLGAFSVQVGRAEVRFRTQRARDLLALLIVHRGKPISKEQILEALWPEGDPGELQELFHTTVYQLRQALKGAGVPVVLFGGGLYRLEREALWVDTETFLSLAGGSDPSGWASAVQHYQGDFLDSLDYPWCEGLRTHFREVYLQVLRRLAKYEQDRGRPEQAALWWQRLVEADPLGEEAHMALVQCYVQTGRRSAAVQQYRTLVRMLQRELGVKPTPAAESLAKRLLSS